MGLQPLTCITIQIQMTLKESMIMKKLICIFLALLLFVPSCFAETQEFQYQYRVYNGELKKNDRFVYYDMGSDTIAIASYIGGEKTADIGSAFPDVKEIWILAWAFTYKPYSYCGKEMYILDGQRYECQTKVQKVILPENTVIKIDHDAFDASNLSAINIPTGLQEIGEAAFANCRFETLPVFSAQVALPRGLFYGGSATKLSIPEGYTELPDNCFWASQTREYTFPNSLKSIGENAFEKSGIAKITLPSGLTTIGEKAFLDCRKLTAIKFPNTLETIPAHAFENCYALNKVEIPFGVKKIDDFAFCACKGLQNISLPASVTEISDSAFAEIPSIRITVISGSFAENWATKAGYKTKVLIPVNEIQLSETNVTIAVNKSVSVKARFMPNEAKIKSGEWVSTDPGIATVNNGKIKGIAPGSCDVICISSDGSGCQSVCHVVVE